jgi:heme/copper-type cytochrome/quinol oxidase subunit 2
MWGSISTEASHQTNFNIGFSNDRCDILIHLSQWQYWWWFWFVLSWSFYYVTLEKITRQRLLKWHPRINTSFKSRGKWGDFFAAIVPLWWCASILINSNSLMRMLEWQNETSIFTLRIRGRQWYWVYKLELKNFTDILSIPKNVGKNKWQINVFGELKTTDDYLHILQLRSQSKWIKDYWMTHLKKTMKPSQINFMTAQDQLRLDIKKRQQNIIFSNSNINKCLVKDSKQTLRHFYENTFLFSSFDAYYSKLSLLKNMHEKNVKIKFESLFVVGDTFLMLKKLLLKKYHGQISPYRSVRYQGQVMSSQTLFKKLLGAWHESLAGPIRVKRARLLKDFKYKNIFKNFLFNKTELDLKNTNKSFYNFLAKQANNTTVSKYNNIFLSNNFNYFEFNRQFRRSYGINQPVRLIKQKITINDNKLFKFRFNNEPCSVKSKIIPHTTYLTLKQKRYKRKRIVPLWQKFKKLKGQKTGTPKYSAKPIIVNNSITIESFWNPTIDYSLIKKAKRRERNKIPVSLNRRLLRTTRTLVLPSHVNISAITNSYDVVHSWFIPGLGLKLDCIPGRSTHHTFYIDNAGFYYGQCAEVCGRYHHHMPIRICALPFDQFLLWWHTFGLPKLLFTNAQKRHEVYYGFRKYVW